MVQKYLYLIKRRAESASLMYQSACKTIIRKFTIMAEGSLVPNSRKKHPDFSIAYGDWLDAINTSLTHARTPELNSFTTRAERTHKLRAALKNTRALLRLAPPTDRRKARRFRRQLALIADSLAKDRDRHVLRETLENLNHAFACAPHSDTIKSMKRFKKACAEIQHVQNEVFKKFKITARAIKLKKYIKRAQNRERQFLRPLIGYPSVKQIKKFDRLRSLLGDFNDLEYAIAKLRGVPQQAAIMPKMIEAKRAVKLIERAQQKQAHLRQKISDCLGTLP
jgi:CHAD domain-containing protein